MRPATDDAIKLWHEGMIALAQIERNGIRMDSSYLEKALARVDKNIQGLEIEFRETEIFRKWKKRFGTKTKLQAKHQLEKVVFDDMGYERTGRKTDKGRDSSNKTAFEFVLEKEPHLKSYFEIEDMKTARKKLLEIKREVIDGWMYPFIDLHKVGTYRSSGSKPNIMNFPVRNEMLAEIVRKCVIPPKGYRIGEIDLSGAEVCGSCCYHKDPRMIKYVTDPSTNMHRDMAMQCYKLPFEEVKGNKHDPKEKIRYCAKNKAVFPWFYGSYHENIARDLWEAVDLLHLKTSDGKSLKRHLKKQGFSTLDRFKIHIEEVERDFWGNRFAVYAQWKKDHWQEYLKKGYFSFLTGFVCQGLYNWKQVSNYPIQGSSFHFLLWSLIRLQNWMNKKKLKSKIIFEIHDSLGIYFHKNEIDYVVEKAGKIMTKDIYKHWPWICVPLSVDVEIAPKGGSWFDKTKDWRKNV